MNFLTSNILTNSDNTYGGLSHMDRTAKHKAKYVVFSKKSNWYAILHIESFSTIMQIRKCYKDQWATPPEFIVYDSAGKIVGGWEITR
jgi:hypothetical protein